MNAKWKSTTVRSPLIAVVATWCVAGLAFAPGCQKEATTGRVVGEVTLDGQPLAAGQMRFVATDGHSPTAGAAVVDGEFSVELPPGEVRVEISAPKPSGKKAQMYGGQGGPAVEASEELLPARYNVASELTLNVGAGEQPAKFELSSGGAKPARAP